MTSTFPRHFAFKHPVFRRSKSSAGDWWEDSVYYFWWEFLRRHEGYKRTCKSGGKGKYAKLYADFGNVHGVTFQQWWSEGDRGARLFAEPPLPTKIMALTSADIRALPENWDPQSLLIVAIPLSLPKRFVEQRFAKILSQHNKRKRGQRTFKESRALYPIAAQFKTSSLKGMLEVYDLRQSQSDLTLWEIGQQLSLTTKLTSAELLAGRGRVDGAAVSKKSVLAVAASKKLKLAKRIVEGVGKGIFPAFAERGKRG
jgi:hypothetical protein